MKGLILCGGRGTRLRPYTCSRPKPLLPVGNQPVIQYTIKKLINAGIHEIGIVVSPIHQSHFQEILGSDYQGASISYIEQSVPMGLAHAVQSAQSFIQNEEFCVVLGDNYYSGELSDLIQFFHAKNGEAVVLVNQVANPSRFGVAQLEGSRVIHLIEKPQNPVSPYAVVGIYVFSGKIFETIANLQPSIGGEYQLTDAIQRLIERGDTVNAMISTEWWRDTGSPEDLLTCNRYILSKMRVPAPSSPATVSNSVIEGSVVIGKNTQIIDSTVRGPTIIGEGCRIIRSSVGPFTSFGDGSQIEDSEIENSVVLEYASIVQVSRPIDMSIIGRNTVVAGEASKSARVLQLHLGDYSKVHIPNL
jgi:glucose-1-phosphate thymidylyltransferase